MTNEEFIKDCDRAIALIRKMREEISGEKKDNYIDLGLPSGTLWADTNEEGFYTFDEAVEKFGKFLPGIAQLAELREFCEWNWDDEKEGYKVTGKNGNSIFLPAAGCRIDNCICESGEFGHLWSSTANSSISDSISFAHSLHFGDSGVNLSGFDDCLNGRSVRLVKPSCWETEQKELM